MHPEYDGVKFYNRNDISVGWQLEKAEQIIMSFVSGKEYKSINEVIELYNVYELIGIGAVLPTWSEEEYEKLQFKAKEFISIIAKFFSKICDENFYEYYQSVAIEYIDDFWVLFDRFKIYQHISKEKFTEFIQLHDITLSEILKHKNLVRVYDKQLTLVMCTSEQTCRILVSKFLEKNDIKYYLPESLKPSEFENIFKQYIDSENANPNILRLIIDAQSTGKCPISDEIRLKAKRKYYDYWKSPNHKVVTTQYGIGISFVDQLSPGILIIQMKQIFYMFSCRHWNLFKNNLSLRPSKH